jgi:hypothetical protein
VPKTTENAYYLRKEHQMAEQIVLTPAKATATYRDGTLTIRASGDEDGVRAIRIVEEAAQIVPPIFAVVGEPSPAIGMFPYTVEGRFATSRELTFVRLATPGGERNIPVSRA